MSMVCRAREGGLMDGPEWAAGKLSEDHKDNRWSLLSADIREIEQRLDHLEQQILAWAGEDVDGDFAARIDYLETVCEQCILEHQGRSQ